MSRFVITELLIGILNLVSIDSSLTELVGTRENTKEAAQVITDIGERNDPSQRYRIEIVLLLHEMAQTPFLMSMLEFPSAAS